MDESEINSRQGLPGDIGPDELLYASGPELYDYLFAHNGKTAKEFIRFEYDSGIGFTGYKNITVLYRNENEVVALGGSFDGKQYWTFLFGTILNVFRFYGPIVCWKVFYRMMDITSVVKQPALDEVYFGNAAVLPELRNTGIATRVLEYKIKEAKRKGYRAITLEVADNNPLSEFIIMVLSSFGFEVTHHKKFTGRSTVVPDVKELSLRLN